MSSTTSVTVVEEQQIPPVGTSAATATCFKCGAELSHVHLDVDHSAQQKIEELEAQVKILTQRATEAVERATDYEDALRQFTSAIPSPHNHPQIVHPSRTSSRPGTSSSDYPPLPEAGTTPYPPNTPAQPPNSRLSRLLPIRRSNIPSLSTAPLHSQPPVSGRYPQYPYTAGLPSTSTETELLTALTREQNLRLAAESQVSQTNEEIEELTGQLFQQANEMVAAERKARAKLEERVAVLEKRDGEKAKRLEVLESRLGRIERVRGLLKERDREREKEKVNTREPEVEKENTGQPEGTT